MFKTLVDVEKFLERRSKQYKKKGFSNYKDVKVLAEKTKLGNKEIKRCQFLLVTLEQLESKLKHKIKRSSRTWKFW